MSAPAKSVPDYLIDVLGQLNLPGATLVDEQAGRAIIVTSPYGLATDCRVLVLDTRTGALLGSVSVGVWLAGPVLDERSGRVFVSGGNVGRGHVYVVDVHSGALLRTITVGWFPNGMALDRRRGRLFVVNANVNNDPAGSGSVIMIDSHNGRVLRTVAMGPHPGWVVIAERAGRIFVDNPGSNSVSVLDASSGRVMRTVTVVQGPNTSADAVVAEGTGRAFVFSGISTNVQVLDTASGRMLRTVAVAPNPVSAVVDERARRVLITSDGSKSLSVLDAWNGTLLRTVRFARTPPWPTLDEQTGRAYIADFNGSTMSVLDTTSGRVLRTVPIGLYARVSVESRIGRVFVVNSNSVRIMERQSGRLLHAILFSPKPIPSFPDEMIAPLFLAVDEQVARAFAVNSFKNSLSVLDARSGAVLRTIPVPAQPVDMLMDERAGHILLISIGGEVRVADPWGWIPPWLRRRLPFLPPSGSHTGTVPASVTVLDTHRL